MLVLSLLFASLAPLSVLAGTPGALRSLSGKDYSHHLKRTDEPFPARFSYAKRGPGSVPPTLKVPAQPILERRSPPAGVLLARQGPGCDQGYSMCSDGNACCPTGANCCTGASICCTSGPCCGNSCCENGGVCCGASGCCGSGTTCQTINGVAGCCAAGQQCESFVGCSNPGYVECQGESFCCPSGETCGRDNNGNATCNGHSVSESQGVAASPTPGDTSIVNPSASSSSSSSQVSTTRSTSSASSAPTSTGSHTTTAPASSTSSSSGNNALNVIPSRDVFGLVGVVALALVAFA